VETYIEIFAIVSIALIGISCVLGAAGALLQSRCILTASAVLGIPMLCIVIILTAAELSLTVVLADLCIASPLNTTAQLIDILDSGSVQIDSNTLASVEYYLTCSGQNPLQAKFDSAQQSIDAVIGLQSTIEGAAAQYCPSTDAAAAIKTLKSTIIASNSTLHHVQQSIVCSNVNPILSNVLVDGACTNIFDGMFAFWTTQSAAGVLLFLTFFFSTYVQMRWRHEYVTEANACHDRYIILAPTAESGDVQNPS